ncbi:MAG: hypothetical protein ACFB8W_03260 [Elainellaceae cyanobacterium]
MLIFMQLRGTGSGKGGRFLAIATIRSGRSPHQFQVGFGPYVSEHTKSAQTYF